MHACAWSWTVQEDFFISFPRTRAHLSQSLTVIRTSFLLLLLVVVLSAIHVFSYALSTSLLLLLLLLALNLNTGISPVCLLCSSEVLKSQCPSTFTKYKVTAESTFENVFLGVWRIFLRGLTKRKR